MHFSASYRPLSLDTIANAATYFSAQWEPALKRNQSPYLLTLIINKLYGSNRGSLFHARIRASHASLADRLHLSRPWTCHLVAVLRQAGWIETEAPRLPDGTQEITIFKLGKQFKRLLCILIKSRQRSRVNDQRQKLPSPEQTVKAKAFFAGLKDTLALKMTMRT